MNIIVLGAGTFGTAIANEISVNTSNKVLIYSRNNNKFIKRVKNIPLEIYFKMFYDSGYIWKYENQRSNNFLNNKYIYSYGIGLDIVTLKNTNFLYIVILSILLV